MNSNKNCARIGIALLGLILTLILAACNGQSQAAAEPDRVTLQLNWVYQAQFAGYFVAEKQGLYTAENLKVDIRPGDGSFRPIDKVIAKEADFAVITDPTEVLQVREAGKPVVAVAAIYQKNANIWISLADKNIKTPKDMIGQRVGIRPVSELTWKVFLTATKIDRAKLNEVVISDFTIRPIIEGEVDVMNDYALSGPLTAKEQGLKVNVMTLADQGVLLPNELLVVHEDLLTTNPDLVKRFVRASLKGWSDAIAEPEKGVKATLQFDETLNSAHQANMMDAVIDLVDSKTTSIGYMDDKMWQNVMQIGLDQKLISAPVELGKVYTSEFLQ